MNLFSIFDPQVVWLNLSLNWVRGFLVMFLFPCLYWAAKPSIVTLWGLVLTSLAKEFSINFKPVATPGHTHWALRLFLLILLNNIGGLAPYVFTRTRHLSLTVSLALVGWVRYTLYIVIWNTGEFLAHLVPVGTPYVLIPFMVLIELVRRLIRPLTLSVRLAANLVAGHLLIVLIRSPIRQSSWFIIIRILVGLVILLVLERAVAFIQAYVFSILRTLYLRETNSVKFNYLCNCGYYTRRGVRIYLKIKTVKILPLASWVFKFCS